MKPTNDIKAFYRSANVETNPAADAAVLQDAIEAGGLVCKRRPAQTDPGVWRFLMQSRIARLAAVALIVVGAIIGLHHFNGTVVQAVEFSEIIKAMEDVPWMHASAAGFERGITGVADQWIGFHSKVHAGRWGDGKVSFWNLRERQRAEYDPNSNTITLTYVGNDEFPLNLSSPAMLLESMHKILEDQGAEVTARMGHYEGHRAQIQEISLRNVGRDGAENHKLTLYIDPDVKLLYAAEVAGADANGNAVIAGGITFDYPQEGPRDIYDLGVPRDAHIVDNMPPSEFRAVLEQYQQIRKESTDEYIAIVTHARSPADSIVTMVDVDFKAGRRHRQERHSVFHRGETLRQLWPTYKEQLGDNFASLLAWSQGHYDDARAGISIHLYDGEYHCSVRHRAEEGWSLLDRGHSPDHDPGPLTSLGHLAWPRIVSTARIIEDDYARENELICIESLSQADVSPSGWASLPSRFLYYLDPSCGYLCRRRVTEQRVDAPWQEDKDWLVGVDPNKVRREWTTMREITEAFQAPNGHWYPKVVVEWSSESRRDPEDQTLEVSTIKRIYLRPYPDFAEGVFDVDGLPGE